MNAAATTTRLPLRSWTTTSRTGIRNRTACFRSLRPRRLRHVFIDLENAARFLDVMRNKPIRLRSVNRVPPLSFALFATKIKEALMVEDPREMTERLFHLWWSKLEQADG